jgi:hypothetical protein
VVYQTTRNGQPWYVLVSGFIRPKMKRNVPWRRCLLMFRRKPMGEADSSGSGRSEVMFKAQDAVGAFSTAGEGVIS